MNVKNVLWRAQNEGRRCCKTLQQLHHGGRSSKIQLVVKDLRAVAGGQVVAGATIVSWHVWLGQRITACQGAAQGEHDKVAVADGCTEDAISRKYAGSQYMPKSWSSW